MEKWKEYAQRLWAISAYRNLMALPVLQQLQLLV